MNDQILIEKIDRLYNLWLEANVDCSVDMFFNWIEEKIGE